MKATNIVLLACLLAIAFSQANIVPDSFFGGNQQPTNAETRISGSSSGWPSWPTPVWPQRPNPVNPTRPTIPTRPTPINPTRPTIPTFPTIPVNPTRPTIPTIPRPIPIDPTRPTRPTFPTCSRGTTQIQLDDGTTACTGTVVPNCMTYRQKNNGGGYVCSECYSGAEKIKGGMFTHPDFGLSGSGIGCPPAYQNLGAQCTNGVTLNQNGQYVCTSGGPVVPPIDPAQCRPKQNQVKLVNGNQYCLKPDEVVLNCPLYDLYDGDTSPSCLCYNQEVRMLADGSKVCSQTPDNFACKTWTIVDYRTYDLKCSQYRNSPCEAGQTQVRLVNGPPFCLRPSEVVQNCYQYNIYDGDILPTCICLNGQTILKLVDGSSACSPTRNDNQCVAWRILNFNTYEAQCVEYSNAQQCKAGQTQVRLINGPLYCLKSSEVVLNCQDYNIFDGDTSPQCICSNQQSLKTLKDGSLVCSPTPSDRTCKIWRIANSFTFETVCQQYSDACEAGLYEVDLFNGGTGCATDIIPYCTSYRMRRGNTICNKCDEYNSQKITVDQFIHPTYGATNSGVGCAPIYQDLLNRCSGRKVQLVSGAYSCA